MSKADAEKLKKEDFEEEEEEEEDDKFIASLANRKNKSPKNRNVAPKPQAKVERERKPQAKVKRERKSAKKEEEDDEDFEKSCSKKAPKRTDNKGQKKNKKEEKEEEEEEEEEEENPEKTTRKRKTGEKKTFQKREKKVFDLPGQKRDGPGERDPSRIFYETLHKQVPASEMAAIWMMESGLLPKDEAKKIFDRKLKRAKEQRLSSPMKTVVTVKRKANSITVEKKYANSPVSKAQKKRTPPSKAKSGPSKKLKIEDGEPSNDDTDDDFVDAERSKKSGPSKKCKIKDGEPSDDDFAVDSGRSKKRRT